MVAPTALAPNAAIGAKLIDRSVNLACSWMVPFQPPLGSLNTKMDPLSAEASAVAKMLRPETASVMPSSVTPAAWAVVSLALGEMLPDQPRVGLLKT